MVSRHTLEGDGAAPFAEQVLESETVEVWQAWLDGDKDNAEMFFVPVAGVHDVAELASSVLGCDVCAELNMERV